MELPVVFRGDTRPPSTIFAEGFTLRPGHNPAGSLGAHVLGESGPFVSTSLEEPSAIGFGAPAGATLANPEAGVFNMSYVYKIQPSPFDAFTVEGSATEIEAAFNRSILPREIVHCKTFRQNALGEWTAVEVQANPGFGK